MARAPVYTVGHGVRSMSGLCALLEEHGVDALVDVRRWPRSSANPHFHWKVLDKACRARGITYISIPLLGGYRRFGRDTRDRGLFQCFRSTGFRAYATYLFLEPGAALGLEAIVYPAAAGRRVAVMCSEVSPWRCHRKIIADWLLLHGFRVVHILGPGEAEEHRGTGCLGEAGRVVSSRLV